MWGDPMKNLAILIVLCSGILGINAGQAIAHQEISAETLFPDTAKNMRATKFTFMRMLNSYQIPMAYQEIVDANEQALGYFFANNPFLTMRDEQQKNLLHYACIYGDNIVLAQLLMARNPELIKQKDEKDKTPIDYAMQFYNLAIAEHAQKNYA